MRNILVPIDFSDATEPVLRQAIEMARCFQAKLWLIHVAAPDPYFVGYDVGPQHERDWRATQLRDQHRDLQHHAQELAGQGLDVTPLLIQGATAETVVGEANKIGAGLIILGSHGHSALYKALVGSVAEGVLRQAACPVLVVPVRKSG